MALPGWDRACGHLQVSQGSPQLWLLSTHSHQHKVFTTTTKGQGASVQFPCNTAHVGSLLSISMPLSLFPDILQTLGSKRKTLGVCLF